MTRIRTIAMILSLSLAGATLLAAGQAGKSAAPADAKEFDKAADRPLRPCERRRVQH